MPTHFCTVFASPRDSVGARTQARKEPAGADEARNLGHPVGTRASRRRNSIAARTKWLLWNRPSELSIGRPQSTRTVILQPGRTSKDDGPRLVPNRPAIETRGSH